MPAENEIKVRLADLAAFEQRLASAGFQLKTPRTHEVNTLYDFPGHPLRGRGELLRLRRYGDQWTLTHKGPGNPGARHKSRVETETRVADGQATERILLALGLEPVFRYEKFRSEWADSTGHVVLDHTPIGDFAEIEGPPDWLDRTASRLGISQDGYLTSSYAELFADWKRRSGSGATEMTFAATGAKENR
ncbi:MAG TPA: class IV adenylate cyclase [Terriglobales bacterium]|nr:class IV adenylate cyclase [Terriglobales bacterium]